LARVRDLPLDPVITITAGQSFSSARQQIPDGTRWALVTDAHSRPLGWVAADDLTGDGAVDPEMAVPGSTLLQPESTLRDALSAMLASSVQLGVVVDEDDAVLGVISVAAISRTLQDGAGIPPS